MGRKNFEPTAEERQKVYQLTAAGFTVEEIAKTIYRYKKPISDKTVRKYFSKELETARIEAVGAVAARLQANNLEHYPPYLTSGELAELLEILQKIIDKEMLANGLQGENLWFDAYIDEATLKGTQSAVTDLSLQSEIYRNERSLSSIIFSPAYFNRLALAHTASYSEWQGLSDELRKTLAGVITEAVFNGSIHIQRFADTFERKQDDYALLTGGG